MKKTILLIFVAIGLLSCAKESITTKDDAPEGVPMSFNISVGETKAAKTTWADGDIIYVFFNGLETKYLILERDGDSWTNSSGGETLLDKDFSGLGTLTLTAVHFPMTVNVSYADSKFSFTSGDKPVYNYYLSDAGKAYSVDGTTVNASIALEKPANFVQLHIAGIQATVANYTLGSAQIRPVACKSVDLDGTVIEEVLQAGARLSGFADSDGAVFAGRLNDPSATNYSFSLASNEKIYTLTRTSGLTSGTMYNFPVLSDGRWSVQNPSALYVDLGLSVKWAKWNVGAASETEPGEHLAWGELRPKEKYNNTTYLFQAGSGFGLLLTKYCRNTEYGKDGFTDALATLEKEDDAAYASWGGRFRMPTYDEWFELLSTRNNTTDYTWTWCDGESVKYNGSTTAGVKIVKKSNSATLFLPAAGLWGNMYVSGDPVDFYNTTHYGYYWSSTLKTSFSVDAWATQFQYNESAKQHVDVTLPAESRENGRSVRPVYSE